MTAQAPDSTFFAEIQRKLPLFLAQFPDAQRGTLTINPSVIAFFGNVPEPTLQRYLAEFGCMGESPQLEVLIPLYLALRPNALKERHPIVEMQTWLRGKGSYPTAHTIVHFLAQKDLQVGKDAHAEALVRAVAGLLCENAVYFDRPIAVDGDDGVLAVVRRRLPNVDEDSLMSVLTLYPLKFAGKTRPAPKHQPAAKATAVDLARGWLAAHPDDPVVMDGAEGFIAAMARAGTPVRGNAAESLIRTFGREPGEAKRVSLEMVKEAIRCLLGNSIGKEVRKISGIGGLTHRVLELGVDAGPDAVKRAYVDLGGRVLPCPREQGSDYRRQLPRVLEEIRREHPEFSKIDVPVRGKGGLKELVWAKGVQANHETIRKYAEELGFTLTKSRAA